MAKIQEELIIIKLSRLHKDNDSMGSIAGEEIIAGLEVVVQELVGGSVIVEVIQDNG